MIDLANMWNKINYTPKQLLNYIEVIMNTWMKEMTHTKAMCVHRKREDNEWSNGNNFRSPRPCFNSELSTNLWLTQNGSASKLIQGQGIFKCHVDGGIEIELGLSFSCAVNFWRFTIWLFIEFYLHNCAHSVPSLALLEKRWCIG